MKKKLLILGSVVTVVALASLMIRWYLPKAHLERCRSNLRQLGVAIGMYVDDYGGWMPPVLPEACQIANAEGVPGGSILAYRDESEKWHVSGLGLLYQHGYASPDLLYCTSTHGTSEKWVAAFSYDEDDHFWTREEPLSADGDGTGELPSGRAVVCSFVLLRGFNEWGGSVNRERLIGRAIVSDLLFFGAGGAVSNHDDRYNTSFIWTVRTLVDPHGVIDNRLRIAAPANVEGVTEEIFGKFFDAAACQCDEPPYERYVSPEGDVQ